MHYKRCRNYLIIVGLLLAAAVSFAKDATLRIVVKPKEAYIFVDGSPSGYSNRNISVEPGKHTIGVYNYGYKPEVREITLDPGRNADLEFALVAVGASINGPWGRIQIKGTPRAAVYLNGKTPEYFVGHVDEFDNGGAFFNCCVQQLIVPVGTHDLTIIDIHSKELWSGSVNVQADKKVIVYVKSGKQEVKPWPDGEGINSLPRFQAGIASATVAVAPVSGSISAAPTQINCGDSTSVSWQTAETVQQTITAESETLKRADPAGSLSVQPKKSTTFQLKALGPGGSLTSYAAVDVNTAVHSSIDVSPAELRYRKIGDKVLEQGASNLGWTATNANSVTIEPLGSVAANGSQAVKAMPMQDANGPVNEVQTYTLVAKNDCGGSDTHTVSVRVTGSIEPIPDVQLVSVFFPTGYPDAPHPNVGLVWSQQQALNRTAEGFKKYLEYDPDARLTVAGNTDVRDSNARNKPLSERRANRVKEYLVSLGIPENKIETVANGKTKQLDASTVQLLHKENPNKPAEHRTSQELVWAYNRRVDIVLLPKDLRSTQYFPGDAPEAKFLADSNWPGQKEVVTLAAEKSQLPNDPAAAR
jgi:hypothetical protein